MLSTSTWLRGFVRLMLFGSAVSLLTTPSAAQSIDPHYAEAYSFVNLGLVPGVPAPYGGLTFLAGDPNTLLLGGTASSLDANIFSIPLVRDPNGHITGFAGPGTFYSRAYGDTAGIDGGLTYGPDGVLFYSTWSDNYIGQIKPGSTEPDKLIHATPLGVAASMGGLMFVPPGFPGEGRLKLISWDESRWYDTTVTPDGAGTFDIAPVSPGVQLQNGPVGFVHIAGSNPAFTADSILVAEYNNGRIASYEIDSFGNPNPSTRREFMRNFWGATGAAIDPLTGDVLFSTWSDSEPIIASRIIRISGFQVPDPVCGAGDLNCDGTVSAADYTAWRDGLGGAFTQDDYDLWKQHFGQAASAAAGGAAAVPEPSATGLAALALGALVLRRRRTDVSRRRAVPLNPAAIAR